MTNEQKPDTDNSLTGKVFSYADLVNYQEGSIVSRTIINKPSGTITLFAFYKGQRLSTHTAPFDALLQVVEGTGLITISNKEFEVSTPAAIIMPANIPHAVEANESFKMTLTMIRKDKH